MSPRGIFISTILLVSLIAGIALLVPGRPAPAAASESTPAAGTPCPASNAEENKVLVRRYYEEAFGQGHTEVLEEVLAEDYVLHIPGFAGILPPADVPASGRTDEARRIQEFRTDFPDLRITVEEIVAEGDRMATRVTIAGTQAHILAAWGSPDTGRHMERESFAFYRVACGKIAEGWVLPDNLTMLRQLGIITDEELANGGVPTVATPVP